MAAKSMLKIVYELYDGRYLTNPDKAICFEVCDTLKEAKINAIEYGDDTVIVKAKLRRTKNPRHFEHVTSDVVNIPK